MKDDETLKFTNYIRVARHKLETCKKFVELLNKDSSIDSKMKKLAAHEIYYLSGYIVEGLMIYIIYKHYEWPEDTPITKGVCNCRGTKLVFQKKKDDPSEFVAISGHLYKNYIDIIRQIPWIENLHYPYFSKENKEDGIKIKKEVIDLIDNWNPQIRYLYPEEIYETTENKCKYEGTLKNVKVDNMLELLKYYDNIYNAVKKEYPEITELCTEL